MTASPDHAPPISRIKGIAFRELVVWYARRHGGDKLRQLLAALPAEQARFFDPSQEHLGILAATWYPAPVIHALLDRMTAGLEPAARAQLAQEGAQAVMGVTLRGIYAKLMAMFVTPQLYARFADRLWSSYFDSGEVTVSIVNPTTAESTVRDWGAHHEVMCLMNTEAATLIYTAMGLRGVRTERRECVDHGAAQCRFVTTWQRALEG